jgi:DNA polymerase-3 subunit alpha (Gram-positive type)
MVYLMHKGLTAKHAFDIMEKVRKGKGLSEEDEKLMKSKHVED